MRNVVVTTSWDDGHILDVKLAALLKKYQLTATFYIAPENQELSPEKRLSREAVRALSKNFEIGAHTLTHPRLTTVTDEDAQEEISSSKTILESWIGKEVSSFCYPSGDYGSIHKEMVKKAGFSLARTTTRFREGVGREPFEIPTTIQAYRHWSDAIKILKRGGMRRFPKLILNWDDLALFLFDNILKSGGVFHLWGHSWEIERNNDWDRLEKVFQHIGSRPGIQYVSNSQLI